MNKTFVIADIHAGHNNIIKYENRPFTDITSMDIEIIKCWNKVVTKNDKVFVLGDVSFYNFEKTANFVNSLNGRKHLIMGNHDMSHPIKWWLDTGFESVSKYPIIYNEFIVMSHEPPNYFNANTPYFYIYGHVHSTDMYKTITKNSACVCIERWDYTPVDIEKIKELVKLV